jgi:hypothetical protein
MTQVFPFLIFAMLVISATVFLRKWTRSIVITIIVAPLVTLILVNVVDYFIEGRLDSLLGLALLIECVVSFVITITTLFLIGVLSRILKINRESYEWQFLKNSFNSARKTRRGN